MRYILILAMIAFSFSASAQKHTDNYTRFIFHESVRFNKSLRLPQDTLISGDTGSVAYKNGHLYLKTDAGFYVRMAKYSELSGGLDTSSLSNRINLKWGKKGDASTNPSTDGIGTTDAQPLRIITNNTERARIYSTAKINFQADVDVLGRVLKRNNVTYVDTARIISKNAPTYLTIPTYDSSNQSTHPDVYYNPNGWNGYKYWMAFTPYPNGNDALENPSIVVSNDGVTWSVPPGVTNPLVPQPSGIGFNYNADTDIMEGEDGKLYIFYIDGTTDVWVISSSDGVTWSTPVKIIDMSAQTILSPSVILDNGVYKMYYVDLVESPNVIKYRTATSPTGTWSSPVSCSFSPIPSGKDLWHMNIDKIGTQYHAIITTSNSGTFNGNLLHFAVSDDGVNFSMKSTPVLGLGTGWDNGRIYRSSLVYVDAGDESYYNLYYGAVNASNEWRIGLTKLKLSQYIRDISTNDKIINFASNDGVSRAILDSNNKLSLRRAGNLSPTGFYPQVEVKTDLANENIQMGMFETSVGSNPYIIGNYSPASSNFHNTGFLSKRNDTLQLGMQLSNSGEFGGTAGATSGGFFGIYDYGASAWLMGFNKSRELYLGPNSSAYGVKLSASTSNYFSQNVGIGTTTPDSLLTVQNGFWAKRGVRLSGVTSSANAADSMMVINATDGTVGMRSIPSGGGSSPTVGTYSTRIGLSPSNGDEFFQTDIGRDAPDGKYYYLNSKWHYNPLNDESLSTFWNEFHTINSNNTISDDGMIFWSGNSGTISYTNTTRPGVARFATSTTTNGYAGFYTGAINNPASWINLPNGTSYFKASININTLSTAGERYAFRIGLANGMLGDFTSGVYLEYDESASANWRIKSANFGTRTTTTSGTAVATGWQTVELLVNSGGTSVEFWVDGVSLGTIPTNIPGAGNGLGPAMIVQKSAGTTSRYIDVDYVKAWQRLNTDRN